MYKLVPDQKYILPFPITRKVYGPYFPDKMDKRKKKKIPPKKDRTIIGKILSKRWKQSPPSQKKEREKIKKSKNPPQNARKIPKNR